MCEAPRDIEPKLRGRSLFWSAAIAYKSRTARKHTQSDRAPTSTAGRNISNMMAKNTFRRPRKGILWQDASSYKLSFGISEVKSEKQYRYKQYASLGAG